MRHFKLENSVGQTLDITTKEILFHEISGLGFEEENDYRQIGDVWWLNHTNYRQATVSGNVIFTESPMTLEDENGITVLDDPYAKFRYFVDFISRAPLTLMYSPYGPIGTEQTYLRTVRVSKLEKSEKNEYGVLDESIEFSCYTPWYTKIIKSIEPEEEGSEEETTGWIWGGPTGSDLLTYALDDEVDEHGERVPQPIVFPEDYDEADPLVFEPDGTTLKVVDSSDPENPVTAEATVSPYSGDATPTIFRSERIQNLDMDDYVSLVKSPVKMTIYGPLVNPSWQHRVKATKDGEYTTVGSGGFVAGSNVSLASDEYLVVDNTSGQYRIYKRNSNGTITDLYEYRNFSLSCFITFREGYNQVIVASNNGEAKHVTLEAHLYYATV